MKIGLVFILFVFLSGNLLGQQLKTGTYVFSYCDFEYNRCLGSCKVVIKEDSITIFATKELAERITLTRVGDTIDQGIILKHKSGKWIVGKTKKDKEAEDIGIEGPAILDFINKQYRTF